MKTPRLDKYLKQVDKENHRSDAKSKALKKKTIHKSIAAREGYGSQIGKKPEYKSGWEQHKHEQREGRKIEREERNI